MDSFEVRSGDLVASVERARDGWSVDTGAAAGADLTAVLLATTAELAQRGGGRVETWIENARVGSDEAPVAAGFAPYRDLLQMRCRLPAAPSDLAVRPFTPADADAFLRVNNRAFDWHPEQGGMTREDLASRQSEDWYDPRGFLLHEIGGTLAGLCWTKVHPNHDPPLGEIYAIAVDPDFHGRGLGGPLTLAGLEWLHGQGLEHGMLYVESDNHRAVRVYERIGFSVHHVNRAYQTHVEAA